MDKIKKSNLVPKKKQPQIFCILSSYKVLSLLYSSPLSNLLIKNVVHMYFESYKFESVSSVFAHERYLFQQNILVYHFHLKF